MVLGFKNKTISYLMFFIVIIALINACYITVRRYVFEKQNTQVDMVMPLKDLQQLATLDSQSLDRILVKFRKESAITTIVVDEDTLTDFENQGKVTIFKGSEIINLHRVGHINRSVLTHLYSGKRKPKPDHHYIFVEKNEDYARIKTFFKLEFGSEKVKGIRRWNILEIIDDEKDLMAIGLGISKPMVKKLQKMGFSVLIRLKNSKRLNAQLVKQKFKSFKTLKNIDTVMFEGDRVLGFPSQLELVDHYFKELNLNLGLVEFVDQLGMKSLIGSRPNSVVRVHTIPSTQIKMMSLKTATQRYVRAAKERGAKLLFMHPFLDSRQESINLIDFNLNFINSIAGQLKHYDFTVVHVKKNNLSQYYKPAQEWELLILTMGICALMIILLNYYIPMTFFHILVFYLCLGLFYYVVLIFGWLSFWSRMMALLTACVFPPLALISQFPKYQKNRQKSIFDSVFFMVKVVGISIVGSVFIVGFLSDLNYLFGIYQFYGVKISLIVPLVLIGLYFYLRPQRISSLYYVFKRLFYAPIRTSYLVSVLLCFLFIIIYIARSGNYFNFYVPIIEENIRSFAEELLFVRPRTKEILIGYPILLFSYYFVDKDISRNWLWFFLILGSVGLISLINSFCHLHTPVIISFYRSVLGAGIGFMIGLLYIFLYQIGKFLLRRSFLR